MPCNGRSTVGTRLALWPFYSIAEAAVYIYEGYYPHSDTDEWLIPLVRWMYRLAPALWGRLVPGAQGRSIHFLQLVELAALAILRYEDRMVDGEDRVGGVAWVRRFYDKQAARYGKDYPLARWRFWNDTPSLHRFVQYGVVEMEKGCCKGYIGIIRFPRCRVEIDPRRCSGSPVLEGTRLTTCTLYQYYAFGERLEHIAGFFGVPVELVDAAVTFQECVEKHLARWRKYRRHGGRR